MGYHRIRHITKYAYPTPVTDSANQIMLYAINDARQQVKLHELNITGRPAIEVFSDYYGNTIGTFSVIAPHQELVIDSMLEVSVDPLEPPPDDQSPSDQWDRLTAVKGTYPYLDFLSQERCSSRDGILDVVKSLATPAITPLGASLSLAEFVYGALHYQKGVTSVESSVDDVWHLKAGVCQDFAHLLLLMLRMGGIPARYVSGYVCPKDHEMRGEGATHAWVEAFIPGYGWLGIDPTNNSIVNERHVRLAFGRSFADCTPVKGTFKGSVEHTLSVSVRIENGSSDGPAPVFSTTVRKEEPSSNSYRKYLEFQQQQ
jgi:transglutaminase-like putative cysteine protease